mgnify:CR=1 FL=1
MSNKNDLFSAPESYMEKISYLKGIDHNAIDLDFSLKKNLSNLADSKNKRFENLRICILDRPRHKNIIEKCRNVGARIMLIPDGDVSGIIATANPDTGVDMYLGIGGAPEGVLAAAALRCIGGQMEARLKFYNEDEKLRAKNLGITDLNKKYLLNEVFS